MRRALLPLVLFACGAPDEVESSTDSLGAPAWIGEAKYAISRATCAGGACAEDLRPLEGGFFFDSWAKQRAAITAGYFEVWQPGVTDFDNPDLWRELDVRIYYRFDPSGPFSWRWVDFQERAGNNARYSFSLRELDPFVDPNACPSVPFRLASDGISYEAELELYIWVNGAELRPAPGRTYHGIYTNPPSTVACTPTLPRVIDQIGSDVAVLEAWFGDRFAPDPNLCDGTDCTRYIGSLVGDPPFLNRFEYPGAGLCELIEIRTVSPLSVLDADSFAGIGFYFAGSFALVPRAELAPVQSVTLRDGRPGVVHRFVARGMCFGLGGNSGAILNRRFEFKPFARFDVAETFTHHRVWDEVTEDYLLGRARSSDYFFVSAFDRRRELLAP